MSLCIIPTTPTLRRWLPAFACPVPYGCPAPLASPYHRIIASSHRIALRQSHALKTYLPPCNPFSRYPLLSSLLYVYLLTLVSPDERSLLFVLNFFLASGCFPCCTLPDVPCAKYCLLFYFFPSLASSITALSTRPTLDPIAHKMHCCMLDGGML